MLTQTLAILTLALHWDDAHQSSGHAQHASCAIALATWFERFLLGHPRFFCFGAQLNAFARDANVFGCAFVHLLEAARETVDDSLSLASSASPRSVLRTMLRRESLLAVSVCEKV